MPATLVFFSIRNFLSHPHLSDVVFLMIAEFRRLLHGLIYFPFGTRNSLQNVWVANKKYVLICSIEFLISVLKVFNQIFNILLLIYLQISMNVCLEHTLVIQTPYVPTVLDRIVVLVKLGLPATDVHALVSGKIILFFVKDAHDWSNCFSEKVEGYRTKLFDLIRFTLFTLNKNIYNDNN